MPANCRKLPLLPFANAIKSLSPRRALENCTKFRDLSPDSLKPSQHWFRCKRGRNEFSQIPRRIHNAAPIKGICYKVIYGLSCPSIFALKFMALFQEGSPRPTPSGYVRNAFLKPPKEPPCHFHWPFDCGFLVAKKRWLLNITLWSSCCGCSFWTPRLPSRSVCCLRSPRTNP